MRLSKLFPAILILVSIGCSSGADTAMAPQYAVPDGITDNVPIIGASLHQDGRFNATGLLGMYELNIDPSTNSAELAAKRTNTIGESFIVNGISFFTIRPCTDCLKLKSIELVPPYIKVIFTISHPFQKGNTSEPPSGLNRLDLDVFDLELIVHQQDATPTEFPLTDIDAYTEICANVDGYTRELEKVINDSTACPFFLVVDDSDSGISTFNLFEMGSKDVEFDTWFVGGRFDLYLTMGFGASAVRKDRLNPVYYNPEFNRKAAWKVDVIPPAESWKEDDGTTPHNVTVMAYDWQIGANVDPELTDTDDIFSASGVGSVSVEITGMNSTLPTVNTPDSGDGTPVNPLIFTVPIANENLLSEGEYLGLVKVTDERVPPSNPGTGDTDALVDVPDGISINYVGMPEFATYQTFIATVLPESTVCGIPSNMEVIATIPGLSRGVWFDGAYAYSASGATGIEIIDVSEPTSPFVIGSTPTQNEANDVEVSGDYAYAADWMGLMVVDVNDPTDPELVGSEYLFDGYRLDIKGNYAYVAWVGFSIVDISVPTAPNEISDLLIAVCFDVEAQGDYAYVATGHAGFNIVNVNDPYDPQVVGNISEISHAMGVGLSGDYAYITDDREGKSLYVVDITDPTDPWIVGSVYTGTGLDVAIYCDYAFITDSDGGLMAIDISDPTDPRIFSFVDTDGESRDVAFNCNYAYLADGNGGFKVIKLWD